MGLNTTNWVTLTVDDTGEALKKVCTGSRLGNQQNHGKLLQAATLENHYHPGRRRPGW
jgi:hypothetical protein